jgi:hypothetical protein
MLPAFHRRKSRRSCCGRYTGCHVAVDRCWLSGNVVLRDQQGGVSLCRAVHCPVLLSHLCGRAPASNSLGIRRGLATWACAAFVAYAAIIYPLIGVTVGHPCPAMPMFGVTPCPVTTFTFGMLLLTIRPVPRWLLAIPVVWSLIGGSAAIFLDVPQDWLLLLSGGIAVPLMVLRDRLPMNLPDSVTV